MMTASKVERWVWALVYGGLILFGLGMSVVRSGGAFGWGIAIAGLISVVVGAALVWVRSRMTDVPKDTGIHPGDKPS